jgi:transglutaminase-like putative cysteine protease
MNKAEKKVNPSGIQLTVPRIVEQPSSAAAAFFMDTVLVLLAVFGAVGCSVTAFNLPILPVATILCTLLLSVLMAAVFHIRRYRFLFLFGLVLIFSAFLYLLRNEVQQGFLITVNRIIDTYAKYSGFTIWGYEVTAKAAQYPLLCTVFVLCAVFILAYFLCWAVVAQHSFLLTFSATFPFLIGSLLFGITPQFYAILLLALCWGTMIFMRLPTGDKQNFEKKHGSYRTGNNAAAVKSGLASLPVILLCFALILTLFPRQTYQRAKGVGDAKMNIIDNINKISLFDNNTMAGNSSHVDLRSTDSIQFTGETLLEVKIAEKYPVYLKGFTGSIYDGFGWNMLPDSDYTKIKERLGGMSVLNLSGEFSHRIGLPGNLRPNLYGVFVRNVRANRQCIYAPYNLVTTPKDITGVKYVNDAAIQSDTIFGIQEYSLYAYNLTGQNISYSPSDIYLYAVGDNIPQGPERQNYYDELNAYLNIQKSYATLDPAYLPEFYKSTVPTELMNVLSGDKKSFIQAEQDYRLFLYDKYTQLPAGIREKVKNLLIKQGMIKQYRSVSEMAAEVTGYLAKTCSYTLTPGKTPEGRDFTDYFLFENRKGYCVHFATAAVVMLRAMGVPARYAEGFIVTNEDYTQDGWAIIRDNRAHAWVEIYQPGFGWQPVEATSGFSVNERMIIDSNPQDYPFNNNLSESVPVSSAASGVVSSPVTSSEASSGLPSVAQSEVSSEKAAEPVPAKKPNTAFLTFLSIIAFLAVLMVAAVLKRKIVLARRSELFRLEDTNRAAIAIYDYLQKLIRFGGENSEEITDIALKARFSQHRISEEELKTMISYVEITKWKIYEGAPRIKQLLLQYFYNLI